MIGPEDQKGGWRIVPDESWRPIVAEYADRIDRIRQYNPWNHPLPQEALDAAAKECPLFPTRDDPKVLSILKRLSVFGGTIAFIAIQSAQTICDLWDDLTPLHRSRLCERILSASWTDE